MGHSVFEYQNGVGNGSLFKEKKSLIVYFVSVSKYIRIFVPQLVELFGKS